MLKNEFTRAYGNHNDVESLSKLVLPSESVKLLRDMLIEMQEEDVPYVHKKIKIHPSHIMDLSKSNPIDEIVSISTNENSNNDNDNDKNEKIMNTSNLTKVKKSSKPSQDIGNQIINNNDNVNNNNKNNDLYNILNTDNNNDHLKEKVLDLKEREISLKENEIKNEAARITLKGIEAKNETMRIQMQSQQFTQMMDIIVGFVNDIKKQNNK